MSSVGGDGTSDLVPPPDLVAGIQSRWPWSEWSNALAIALNESGWNPDAVNDTTDADHPCGWNIGSRDGVMISAERSVSYFQINVCNYPEDQREWLATVDGNLDAAYALWRERSWQPWYFSAVKLGLL